MSTSRELTHLLSDVLSQPDTWISTEDIIGELIGTDEESLFEFVLRLADDYDFDLGDIFEEERVSDVTFPEGTLVFLRSWSIQRLADYLDKR